MNKASFISWNRNAKQKGYVTTNQYKTNAYEMKRMSETGVFVLSDCHFHTTIKNYKSIT